MRWLVALCAFHATVGQTLVGKAGDLGLTAFTKYPNYIGLANISGGVAIYDMGANVYNFTVMLRGAEASGNVSFAVHSGISCASVAGIGGHFFAPFNGTDPWTAVLPLTASLSGDVGGSFTINFGYQRNSFVRHALVVYDTAMVAASCTLINDDVLTAPTQVYPATLTKYPGYGGALNAGGLVNVWDAGTGTIQVQFQLTGLTPHAIGGLHIHTGRDCASSGPHFWLPPTPPDPWVVLPATYQSDAAGNADGTFNINIGAAANATQNRAVVVHDNNAPTNSRAGCGLLGGGGAGYSNQASVATFGAYPGSGGTTITGSIAIQEFSPPDLQYRFVPNFANAAPGSTVLVHIHAGVSCADTSSAGGHMWKPFPSPDPWTTISLTADASGFVTSPFELEFGYPKENFIGHVMVIHNSTSKVSCGQIADQSGVPPVIKTTVLAKYPGYNGLTVTGEINVWDVGAGLNVNFRLAGLNANTSGGVHIHTGRSCDSSGPHYWLPMTPPDPWFLGYSSNPLGFADGSFLINSGVNTAGNINHAVVVHDGDGAKTRVACGNLDGAGPGYTNVALTAAFGRYPGTTGSFITGTVTVGEWNPADGQYYFKANLAGAAASSSVSFHIHSGVSCTDGVPAVGGHLWAPFDAPDPWTTVTLPTNASGHVTGAFELNFGYMKELFIGHAMVIHDSTKAPISCGLLGNVAGTVPTSAKATLTTYPGYNGTFNNVRGEINIWDAASGGGIVVNYRLTGVPPSLSGGLHVHVGTDCNTVGAHYYTPAGPDPWVVPLVLGYASNNVSKAEGTFMVATGYNLSGNMLHPVVVHDNDVPKTKIACGVLGATNMPTPSTVNTCTCPNGIPATGTDCEIDGGVDCSSCDSNYYLSPFPAANGSQTCMGPCAGAQITGVFSGCRVYDLTGACTAGCANATAAFVAAVQNASKPAVTACLRGFDTQSRWLNGNLSLLIDKFTTDPATICTAARPPVSGAPVVAPLCVGALAFVSIFV